MKALSHRSPRPAHGFGARLSRGITLIEALVALVVIAVGMLSLAQVQVQLRFNAEISRQRAEALRFAQEDMERWRAFSKLTGGAEGAYDYIATAGIVSVTGQENVNTAFQITRSVLEEPTDARYKAMQVRVGWSARNGETYSVDISSIIGKIDPTLAAQMSNPPSSSGVHSPFNRNIRIPTTAVDLGGGKSGFTPPGTSSGYYVFNNTDATTLEFCTGTLSAAAYTSIKNATSSDTCEGRAGYFYSGFLNFDLRNNISAISPGSSVCDFYSDLQTGGLIASTNPTLSVSSVVLERGSPASTPTSLGAQLKEYFVNVLTLSSSSPSDYQAGITVSNNLSVTLGSSTNINPDTVYFSSTSAIILRVKGGATVETFTPTGTTTTSKNVTRSGDNTVLSNVLSISSKKAVLTLDPTSNLAANTVYELVIPASSITLKKSATTDTNSGSVTITFSTGTAPVLSSTSPADGGTIGSLSSNLTMTFDRNVVGGTGVVTLFKTTNGSSFSILETFNVATGIGGSGGSITFSGTTVTINPGADLVNGIGYSIQVESAAIKDTNGFSYAGISNNTTFNFDSPTTTTTSGACPTSAASVLNYMEVGITSLSSSISGAQSLCYSDAAAGVTSSTNYLISYFCVVYLPTSTPTSFTWAGVPKLYGPSGWLSGSTRRYTVCRYHDLNNNGSDTIYEHPASYSGVGESITDQNFLIVKDNKACPDDTLNVGSQTGVVVYFNTAQFQP
jgi:Tfp pilus assembly protein PilV